MKTPAPDLSPPPSDATDPPVFSDGAPGAWPRWPRGLVVANLVFLAAAMAVPTWLAVADEAADRVCLAWLAPLMAAVIDARHALESAIVRGTGVPIAAAVAVVLYAIARFIPWVNGGRVRPPRWRGAAPYLEAAGLWALTLVVVVYRFYALNRLLPDNIGEMTYSVIATWDLQTLLEVNAGVQDGPWSPLGLVYYLLQGALLHVTGTTILSMRIIAAVTSVLVTQILYYFVRLLGGPLAAILAAAWYAASPVEMVWSRHDMFPFNAAAAIVLGLASTTYLAVTRFRTRDWVATALLMAATYHLFASGFTGFLIPLGVLVWLALFDRPRLRRCGWNVLWVGVGLLAWALGRSFIEWLALRRWEWVGPLDPRLGGRVLRGGGWGAWQELWTNIRSVLNGLYLDTGGDVHQTPLSFFGAPTVYVDGLVAIFFSVGLAWALFNRKQPAVPVLLALMAASLLPGLTSTADAHRLAVFFPAVCAVAALVAAGGLRRLQARLGVVGTAFKVALPALVLAATLLRIGGVYFERDMGEPPNVTIYKAVRPFLTPGTIAIVDLPVSTSIDVVYQMFDQLRADPIAFVMPEGRPWPTPLEAPKPQLTHLFYRETALRDRLPELEAMHWTRAVYFLHDSMDGARKLEVLKAAYPEAKVTLVHPPTWRPGHDFTAVEVPLGG